MWASVDSKDIKREKEVNTRWKMKILKSREMRERAGLTNVWKRLRKTTIECITTSSSTNVTWHGLYLVLPQLETDDC